MRSAVFLLASFVLLLSHTFAADTFVFNEPLGVSPPRLSKDGKVLLVSLPSDDVVLSNQGAVVDTLDAVGRAVANAFAPSHDTVFGFSYDAPRSRSIQLEVWRMDGSGTLARETLVEDIPALGGFGFFANNVTPDGTVFVGGHAPGINESVAAFYAYPDESFTVPDIFPADTTSSVFWDVSDDGAIAVGTYDLGRPYPFKWTRNSVTIEHLPVPDGWWGGDATQLSADGSVVVGSVFNEDVGRHLAFWTEGNEPLLVAPVATATSLEPQATTSDASRVFGRTGSRGSGSQIFVYSEHRGVELLEDVLSGECGLSNFTDEWTPSSVDGASSGGQVLLVKVENKEDRRRTHALIELGVPGDTDGNNVVNFQDFLALSSSFGLSGTLLPADFDEDGRVSFQDFLTLSSHFGESCYELPNDLVVTVPEPLNCGTFFVLGTVLLLLVRLSPLRNCGNSTRRARIVKQTYEQAT